VDLQRHRVDRGRLVGQVREPPLHQAGDERRLAGLHRRRQQDPDAIEGRRSGVDEHPVAPGGDHLPVHVPGQVGEDPGGVVGLRQPLTVQVQGVRPPALEAVDDRVAGRSTAL
jgi:hypothetical protein